ncbi:ATP-binding protein [Shewanella baltica]|uniref:ATP-binding protein n=1 Tax=Shewanella baltica TaxID=62322 RepID=UPI00217D8EFF|nr:sensor histidine kinase [Shewanella baltica]MCS6175899.1 sensor histidine kinase [Shewanella baltica]
MRRPKRLETWLISGVTCLSLLLCALFGGISYQILSRSITEQSGAKALGLAHAVATRTDVITALQTGHSSPQLLAAIEGIRLASKADFIVVGDTHKYRIVHPDSDKIGKKMEGGDSQAALEGESYISEAQGSLGRSIRGKVPVLDEQGQIIGLVSVGFLSQSVGALIDKRIPEIIMTVLGVLLMGVLVAFWMGRQVREMLFGLQPAEIGRLFVEQDAILNTVRMGVVALDADGRIRKLNQRAREILALSPTCQPNTLMLSDLLPQHADFLLTNQNKTIRGFELFANEQWLVMSRVPFQVRDQNDGLLLTMRPADEIERLSQQLAKVQEFAEMLRVQTHDYSNKLHTLGALLQLKAYDKAVEFIGQESQGWQAQIHLLLSQIHEPTIAGLLLGKYHKAKELNIEFQISPDSQLSDVQDAIMLERMVSIMGNLIDNAIEAVHRANNHKPRRVVVTLDETASNLIFDVEDSGDGISKTEYSTIFDPDYSSKQGAQHGVGMYIVNTYLCACHGSLEFADSDLGGARFSVYIPTKPLAEVGTV